MSTAAPVAHAAKELIKGPSHLPEKGCEEPSLLSTEASDDVEGLSRVSPDVTFSRIDDHAAHVY
jgi:hypothetical protein